jgi:hypothetical protein
MGGECGKYGGEEVGVQDLMEKSEGKRPLVRPRYRWDHRRNLGGGGQGGNDSPMFFYLRIVFFFFFFLREENKAKLVTMRGKGCAYIKGWFKPIFPIFLTLLLRKSKFLMPMVDFA